MHITIDKSTLFPVVAQLNSIVSRNSTIPVLSNILFVTMNKTLVLTANNLELALSVGLPLDSFNDEKKGVTIPSQKLYDILRELPDDLVDITTDENHRVMLQCGRSRFQLIGLPNTDFPEIPAFESHAQIMIPQPILKDLIQKTLFAVSHDDSRHALCGINMEIDRDTLTFSATDGVKLSTVTRTPDMANEKPATCIVPLKAMTELKKLCDGEDEITLSWNAGQVSATLGSTCLVSRLIDGTFPDYRQVLPTSNTSTMTVDTGSLSQALRRVLLLAPGSHLIKFALSTKTLTLSTTDPNLGEATETLEVGYNGEDLAIGFNGRFCLDILSVAGNLVSLHLMDALSPGLWTSNEDDGWQAVLMPMRLKD